MNFHFRRTKFFPLSESPPETSSLATDRVFSEDSSGTARAIPAKPTFVRPKLDNIARASLDDFAAAEEDDELTDLDGSTSTANQHHHTDVGHRNDALSVFQFSTGVYFVQDDEGCVEVEVMRIGSTHTRVWVEYGTDSGTATMGSHFEQAKGTIVFNVGEFIKTISVRILQTHVWQPPLDFAVRLERPSPGAQVNVTSQLDRARVWVLHAGKYPSDNIDASSSRVELLKEFCRKCLANDIVRRGTIKTLLIDQLSNVVYLWQLWLSVLFVDHVLDATVTTADGGKPYGHLSQDWRRRDLAIFIGLSHALPMFPAYWLQERKCWLGVGGAARKTLQVDILRKYLQFTEASRKRVGPAGFIEALYRDSVEVVDHGYMEMLSGVRACGKIAVILIFSFFHAPYGVPLQLLLPIFMWSRMLTQEKVATTLRLKFFRAQNRMLAHADDVSKNFLLIRDYQRRPYMSERMSKLVDDVNYFQNAVTSHKTRQQLAVPLFSVCTAGALMCFAPWIADEFGMSAGVFLAVLTATQNMGHEAETLFAALLQIQLAISALLKIYSVMNMQTDIAERMLANRKQRERGRDVVEDSEDSAGTPNSSSSKGTPLTLTPLPTNRLGGGSSFRPGWASHRPDDGGGGGGSGGTHNVRFEADAMCIELNGCSLQPPEVSESSVRDEAARWCRRASCGLSATDVTAVAAEHSRGELGAGSAEGAPASEPTLHPDLRSRASAEASGVLSPSELSVPTGRMARRGMPRRRMAAVQMKMPLQDVNLRLTQGRVYAVVGAHGSGKSALLRMLAKALFPTSGEVFVPPHLSIVHVEQAPQLVRHLSLYHNLTLGYRQGKRKPSVEQVVKVCEGLGLSEHMIAFLRKTEAEANGGGGGGGGVSVANVATAARTGGLGKVSLLAAKLNKAKKWMDHAGVSMDEVQNKGKTFQSIERPHDATKAAEVPLQGELEDDDEEQAWESKLSSSDRQIIHLARAFITNPHLLVFHRPWANFDGPLAQRLCGTIRAFVNERGANLDGKKGVLARTVIFSCSPNDERAVESADAVVTVGLPQGGASVHEASSLRRGPGPPTVALTRLLGDATASLQSHRSGSPGSTISCASSSSLNGGGGSSSSGGGAGDLLGLSVADADVPEDSVAPGWLTADSPPAAAPAAVVRAASSSATIPPPRRLPKPRLSQLPRPCLSYRKDSAPSLSNRPAAASRRVSPPTSDHPSSGAQGGSGASRLITPPESSRPAASLQELDA